jgi:hypothetical protein
MPGHPPVRLQCQVGDRLDHKSISQRLHASEQMRTSYKEAHVDAVTQVGQKACRLTGRDRRLDYRSAREGNVIKVKVQSCTLSRNLLPSSRVSRCFEPCHWKTATKKQLPKAAPVQLMTLSRQLAAAGLCTLQPLYSGRSARMARCHRNVDANHLGERNRQSPPLPRS